MRISPFRTWDIPSWSWAGCEGTMASVEVYDAHARSVRLLLNGKEVGTARFHDFVARADIEYQPGKLTAIALDEGVPKRIWQELE